MMILQPETPKGREARPLVLSAASGLGVLFLLASSELAFASDPSQLCLGAAGMAAQERDVPRDVLVAIALTETGRAIGGDFLPWPWTVNAAGEGHWFPDRESAARFAEDLIGAGLTNFDVGCFQINYRWHGASFTSVDTMFDPETGARYAADLLSDLAGDRGDWIAAAGAYHSRTPELAARYIDRFDSILSALGGGGPAVTPPDLRDGYLLLQARDGTRTPGSLVTLPSRPLS